MGRVNSVPAVSLSELARPSCQAPSSPSLEGCGWQPGMSGAFVHVSRSQLALLLLDYSDRGDRKHVRTGDVRGKGIGYPIGAGSAWIPG
jgi:hypothetical protein